MDLNLDAPFDSFQKRLGAGQLAAPQLNNENRRRFGIPQFVVREAVPVENPTGVDFQTWEQVRRERKFER